MKKKINIGLYGASPYNGNKGVVALSYSTVFLLEKILDQKKIPYELYLIHGDKVVKEYETINFELDKIPFKSIAPINVSSLRSLARFLISPNQWRSIPKYLKMDILLNIGGGDSFSDIYGRKRFKSINSQYQISRILKITNVILPQTIGPFYNTEIKNKAAKSLNHSSEIMVRDSLSFDEARKLTKKDIHEFLDLAFFLPFKKLEFNPQQIHVGINVSSLCWYGGYTLNNQFELNLNYKELTYEILDFFLLNDNVIVHLIPHVVLDCSDIENDYEVCLNLMTEYNNHRIICAPFFLDPISAKSYISGMDFFVGARMHSVIAAFSSGVPNVPLSYSRKFEGLFKNTLNYSVSADMKKLNIQAVIQLIKTSFQNRLTLKKEINQILIETVEIKKENLSKKIEKIIVAQWEK